MWQNSKVSPLIERLSPGVASQTPLWTRSPLAASCAQVLKAGSPAISLSGSALDSRGGKVGLVSMVLSRDKGKAFLVGFNSRATGRRDQQGRGRRGGA